MVAGIVDEALLEGLIFEAMVESGECLYGYVRQGKKKERKKEEEQWGTVVFMHSNRHGDLSMHGVKQHHQRLREINDPDADPCCRQVLREPRAELSGVNGGFSLAGAYLFTRYSRSFLIRREEAEA